MSNIVLEEKRGPITVLTLNDPDRANPLSLAMVVALSEALERTASDNNVRAVVLTGAGRHFSAGADLETLEELAEAGDEAASRSDTERLRHLYRKLVAAEPRT